MRTTLQLDDDVVEAARSIAALERRPLGKVVSELARRGLAPREHAVAADHSGFPIFQVTEDAPPITPRMVDEALDQE